jgi:hypothetical protein
MSIKQRMKGIMSTSNGRTVVNSDNGIETSGVLPSMHELLRGAPLLGGEVSTDLSAFVVQVAGWVEAKNFESVNCLLAWKGSNAGLDTLANLTSLENIFDEFESPSAGLLGSRRELAERCHFYRAVSGDLEAARRVAGYAVTVAYSRELPGALVRPHVAAAVGWLLVATGAWQPPQGWTLQTSRMFFESVLREGGLGLQMVERMLLSRQRLLETTTPAALAQQRVPAAVAPHRGASAWQNRARVSRRRSRVLH